jgi:dihydrodipicolinate synthase/N-acetylneuraminate lyase
MSLAERKRVAKITVDQVQRRIAVIVHVGTTSTAQSIELAQHAESLGVDAVAAVPPYYHSHDEREVLEFFWTLVRSVELPVFVYNNPKTSGFTLRPHFLEQLAGEGVQGIKDSGFSFVEFSHFILALERYPDFTFIIGTEAICLPALMVGAKACISGLANAFPEVVIQLYDAVMESKFKKAIKLQLLVNRARQILHIPSSTNAACYRALAARGIDVGQPKPPILPVCDEEGSRMVEAFKTIGLL